jgi:hypothetical protein
MGTGLFGFSPHGASDPDGKRGSGATAGLPAIAGTLEEL